MEVLTELGYIGVSCGTLLCWDLIDFYTVLRRHEFLWTKPFVIHYMVRAFFSIAIMEILFTSNLLNIGNKFIIAVITPLLFPIILQNLVIEIGGKGDIRDVFLSFREAILGGMRSRLISKKVRIQTNLLNSSLSNDYLKQQCLLLTGSAEFDRLENLSQKKLFSRNAEFEDDLNKGILEKWKDIFKTEGFLISENAKVTKEKGDNWVITDGEKIYIVKKEEGKLNIYQKDKDKARVGYIKELTWGDLKHAKYLLKGEKLNSNIEDYKKARREVEKKEVKTGFIIHLAIYIIFNALIFLVINLVYTSELIWFLYHIIIFWGIGIFGVHLPMGVLLFDKWWNKEEEQIKGILGKKK